MDIDELKGTTAEALLRFAVDSERMTESFYRLVAGKLKIQRLQILFAEFADQEELHRKTYEAMTPGDIELPPEEELRQNVRLMHEFFRGRFFSPEILQEKLKKLHGAESAYDMAVSLELDSMIFYGELKPLMPARHRPVVDGIIAQERSHFQRLLRIKQARDE